VVAKAQAVPSLFNFSDEFLAAWLTPESFDTREDIFGGENRN
jgi:hypothetical protein